MAHSQRTGSNGVFLQQGVGVQRGLVLPGAKRVFDGRAGSNAKVHITVMVLSFLSLCHAF